jgi:hypothetical protein
MESSSSLSPPQATRAGTNVGRVLRPQQQQRRASSLEDICRHVIVANLERYSPSIFSILFEDEWENIIRLRHLNTKPKEGSGGLDGTGRMAPALSDKVLRHIELDNPHLAESSVADQLVWRDCVEYRFRRDNTGGGLTRPPALYLPWPGLIHHVNELADKLVQLQQSRVAEEVATKTAATTPSDLLLSVIDTLLELPMSVSLLQATGVGKVVGKAVRNYRKREENMTARAKKNDHNSSHERVVSKLEQLLQQWKDLATAPAKSLQTEAKSPQTLANNRVVSLSSSSSPKQEEKPKNSAAKYHSNSSDEQQQLDLASVETCLTWRQLFCALQRRQDDRRSSQGKRMREIRKNLASGRPKIVKVRPATKQQERILAGTSERHTASSRSWGSSNNGNPKLVAIRHETAMHAARHANHPACRSNTNRKRTASASFGDAVAFVSGSKAKKKGPSSSFKQKARTIVPLNGGKMAVPETGRAGILQKLGASKLSPHPGKKNKVNQR